jgi:hypothetical protein
MPVGAILVSVAFAALRKVDIFRIVEQRSFGCADRTHGGRIGLGHLPGQPTIPPT